MAVRIPTIDAQNPPDAHGSACVQRRVVPSSCERPMSRAPQRPPLKRS